MSFTPQAGAGPPGAAGAAGADGPAGIAGAAGPAGLTWKGAYSSGVNYALNDVVQYQGATYRAKQAILAGAIQPTQVGSVDVVAGVQDPVFTGAALVAAGAQTGDRVIIHVISFAGNNAHGAPVGWSAVRASDLGTGGIPVRSSIFSKLLTAADLTTNHMVTGSGSTSYATARILRNAGAALPTATAIVDGSNVTGAKAPLAGSKPIAEDLAIAYWSLTYASVNGSLGAGGLNQSFLSSNFNHQLASALLTGGAGATPATPVFNTPASFPSGGNSLVRQTVIVPALAPQFTPAQWDYIAQKGDPGVAGSPQVLKAHTLNAVAMPQNASFALSKVTGIDTVDNNTLVGATYSAATSRLTVTEAGWWAIGAFISMTTAGAGVAPLVVDLGLAKNGVVSMKGVPDVGVRLGYGSGSYGAQIGLEDIVFLAVNDFIEIFANSPNAPNSARYGLTAHRIGS